MTRAGRVKRLRDLIAEIELLPVSPERDRLLSEFRSRAVDVDTGVAPRAMLPMAESAPEPVRAPAGRAERPDDPFWVAEWLSSDDPAPAFVRTRGGRAVRT